MLLGRPAHLGVATIGRSRRAMSVMAAAANGSSSGGGGSAPQRVVIVGGVAGGASCAARLRRLSENVEITLFERGPYVSFANCGLPYYIGDVIKDQSSLLVANAAKFKSWFNVDVKENTEVVSIDCSARKVRTREVLTGKEADVPYDALVLAPGAAAIRPPLPGIDLPGIFVLKTIPDSNAVKEFISQKGVKTAVVVGGGFIGLEAAENLVHRGITTHIVEMLPQVMPPFDPEMVAPAHDVLRRHGVQLHMGDGVAGFEQGDGGKGLVVRTQAGAAYPCDMVILAIGVRPESGLAKAAGLELGARGGIRVDESMRTSDPAIYAVGDAAEVKDFVTGEHTLIPLAGPANRQGRIAANAMMGKQPAAFRGSQGTGVVGLFGLTLASTGASEKTLKRAKIPYEKVYVHINNHAGYYPGAKQMDIKLMFAPADGRILGMQAAGEGEGVEKRVDVVAMALQKGGTVFDLEEAELCYAPQFGSAKDPVNIVGMVAANVLRGDHPVAHWDDDGGEWQVAAAKAEGALIVDVREPSELEKTGRVNSAVNMPLSSLRTELAKMVAADSAKKQQRVYVYCQVGLRGYIATRQLLNLGFTDVHNVSGGYKSYLQDKSMK